MDEAHEIDDALSRRGAAERLAAARRGLRPGDRQLVLDALRLGRPLAPAVFEAARQSGIDRPDRYRALLEAAALLDTAHELATAASASAPVWHAAGAGDDAVHASLALVGRVLGALATLEAAIDALDDVTSWRGVRKRGSLERRVRDLRAKVSPRLDVAQYVLAAPAEVAAASLHDPGAAASADVAEEAASIVAGGREALASAYAAATMPDTLDRAVALADRGRRAGRRTAAVIARTSRLAGASARARRSGRSA